MATNLPANIETLSTQELMELTGQKQQQLGLGIPSLRVNYDDEDDNGNKIPRGSWALSHEGQMVYASAVRFQPILKTYQYSHYDQDQEKMVAMSIHFSSFGDEVPDDSGGFKCGKVNKKQLEQLTEAEQKVQKSIKLSQVFFGFVSFEGVNAKGAKVTITNAPCVFYAKGSHYMPMSDFLDKLTNDNKLMQTIVVQFDLKRQKNGGVTYWEVVPSVAEELKPDPTMFEALRKFGDTVKAENTSILGKWAKNRSKREAEDVQTKVATRLGLDADTSPLGDDFKAA